MGEIKLKEIAPVDNGKYKIIIHSKALLLNSYQTKLNVATANKNTNVLKLSIVEANREKGRNFLDGVIF